MSTTPETQGEQLKAWRCSRHIPLVVMAAHLDMAPWDLERIEVNAVVPDEEDQQAIERILTSTTDGLVEYVTTALHSALAVGKYQQVHIIFAKTAERGRMVIVIGDDEE